MQQERLFGFWMKQRRKALDITQDQLARQVGCSPQLIYKIESGERRPSKQVAQLLLKELHAPYAEWETLISLARWVRARVPDAGRPQLPRSQQASPPPAPALPVQTTSFIGREEELGEIQALLRSGATRVLTITGPGGTGKTRLAIEVARELASAFPHGITFVALDALSDPSLLASTIAQTLGLRETPGETSLDVLKRGLQGLEALLLLDNFEQIEAAAPQLAELLAVAPGLRLLVTSRVRLHIYGEHEFVLAPLPLPDSQLLIDPSSLLHYGAVRLFVERAQALRGAAGLPLSGENLQAIVAICARLDGLPLAIELAAAHVKLFSPRALLARLSNALNLLVGGPRDLPARHQTLRGAIDWSYNLLSTAEQQLFQRLAVFRGGASLDSVDAIAGPALGAGLLEGLSALLDHSLILQRATHDGEPRLLMLETIREYALERLGQSGELEPVRRQHAQHYLQLVVAAEPELSGKQQRLWLERLEQEHDNLRAALGCMLEQGDVAGALTFVGAVWKFWQFRSHYREGRRWMEAALALPGADGQPPRIPERAKALWGAARLVHEQGEFGASGQLFAESLALAQALGDTLGIARALHGIAEAPLMRGELETACGIYAESLELFRALDDPAEIGWSLHRLGHIRKRMGLEEQALADYHEGLAVFRAIDHVQGVLSTLLEMGDRVYLWRGDYDQARVIFEECLALARAQEAPFHIARALHYLGRTNIEQGRYAEALPALEESLAVSRTIEDRDNLKWTLLHLGRAALGQGRYRMAEALLEEAISLAQQQHELWGEAWATPLLARAQLGLGQMVLARLYYFDSLERFQRYGEQVGVAHCLEGIAALQEASGAASASARLLSAADALRAQLQFCRPALDQQLYDATLAAARAQLAPDELAQAWASGANEPLDALIGDMLSVAFAG